MSSGYENKIFIDIIRTKQKVLRENFVHFFTLKLNFALKIKSLLIDSIKILST